MAAAIAAGLGYSWSCLGVPTPVLHQVAEVCSQLLGRPLACQPPQPSDQHPRQQLPQQQPEQQQCQVGTKRPPPCSPGSLAAAAAESAAPAGVDATEAAISAASAEDPVDLLDRLLAAGHKLREVKEAHLPDVGYGWLRLSLAHLGRCNPGPWN